MSSTVHTSLLQCILIFMYHCISEVSQMRVLLRDCTSFKDVTCLSNIFERQCTLLRKDLSVFSKMHIFCIFGSFASFQRPEKIPKTRPMFCWCPQPRWSWILPVELICRAAHRSISAYGHILMACLWYKINHHPYCKVKPKILTVWYGGLYGWKRRYGMYS